MKNENRIKSVSYAKWGYIFILQEASTSATIIWGTKPRIHMTKVFQAYLGRSEESREV